MIENAKKRRALQEQHASLGRAFFRGADACVLVCAINDSKSLEQLVQWKHEFLQYAEPDGEVPFVLVVNKCDLKDAAQLSDAQIAAFCKTNGITGGSFECSALTNSASITEAFLQCAKLCK